MDPFVTFKMGKDEQTSDIAHDAGKECSWNTTMIFKYYDDTNLNVQCFDEDVTTK